MSRTYKTVVVLAIAGCFGCDEREKKDPNELVTIIYNGGSGGNVDRWYFATDDEGKVLDVAQLQPHSNIVLRSTSRPARFNLTLCVSVNNTGNPTEHYFDTYAGIAKGSTIRWDHSTAVFEEPPPVVGYASFFIQNCDRLTSIFVSDGTEVAQLSVLSGNYANGRLTLRQATSRVLITSRKSLTEPVYGWVDDVVPGGEYIVDFTALQPLPKTISVYIPGGGFSSTLKKRNTSIPQTGYTTMTFSPGAANESRSVLVGYLDGFNEYEFNAFYSIPRPEYEFSSTYFHRGPTLPEQVSFPDTWMSVTNSSIRNFEFTTSSTGSYRIHRWIKMGERYPTILWSIHTNNVTPQITEVPIEIQALYPEVEIDDLTYTQTSFIQHADGYTYDKYVLREFDVVQDGPWDAVWETFKEN